MQRVLCRKARKKRRTRRKRRKRKKKRKTKRKRRREQTRKQRRQKTRLGTLFLVNSSRAMMIVISSWRFSVLLPPPSSNSLLSDKALLLKQSKPVSTEETPTRLGTHSSMRTTAPASRISLMQPHRLKRLRRKQWTQQPHRSIQLPWPKQ